MKLTKKRTFFNVSDFSEGTQCSNAKKIVVFAPNR